MHAHRLRWVQPVIASLLTLALPQACGSAGPTPTASLAAAPSPTRLLALSPTVTLSTLATTATPTLEPTATPGAPVFWFSGPDVTFQDVHFTLPTDLASEIHALAAPATDVLGERYPAYTEFTLVNYNSRNTRFEPRLQIYPVSELGQAGTQVAQELKEILAEKPASLRTGIGIPILPVLNAGQLMDAQVRYLTFTNGSGIRVLTQFAQNTWPISNEGLLYVFQGLTSDGAYYISAILPVAALFLPDHVDDPASVPAVDGVSFPEFNSPNFDADYAAYQRSITDKLNETSPEAFTPSLSMLDDLIASMQVGPVALSSGSPAPESLSTPCLNAPPTRLRIGLFAYVDPDPPLPNNVRSEAGTDQDFIGAIEPGKAIKILDGPKCADGWVWWKVRALETELVGWTPEGDQKDYWLIPCSSQKACHP